MGKGSGKDAPAMIRAPEQLTTNRHPIVLSGGREGLV